MELVTGSTGIVGAHVLLERAAAGATVRALHRSASDRNVVQRIFSHYAQGHLFDRVQWIQGDLLDVGAVADAMRGVRHVYHTAAIVSFDPRRARDMYRVNTQGTARIVDAALEAGVRRLCHVSSTAAIGWAAPGIERTESLEWVDDKRTSAYARSKYQAELEVQRGIAEGLDAVIVNPSVIIGPGASGRSSMALVERVRKGMRYYTGGSNAFVDARDVAACMALLMEQGATGERYLLVGENATYQRFFQLLAEAFGMEPPSRKAQPWMLDIAWRLERLRTMITRGEPLVTRATTHSASTVRSYSNAKVTALLGGYRFRSLAESVANVSAFVKSEGTS